ncbi:MAG: polyribonucleotide nucleotidyltransferase [Parcubacteria group bacterium LiPW_15]|nr:MAG: polyribonucleotide nucleotidyltransferase [Parcubacteria group bacterium LiPW_15]
MIKRKTYEVELGGKKITLEVSSIAEQANAAVMAKCGETVVLATVVMSGEDTEGDYMPLKVDYEERFYAAGKILGSRYVRREGKASEEAVLAGRIIDRTIRPLFDQRLRRDIQVIVTVLALDEENEPEQLGLLAISAALAISDIPWNGPAAGVRIGKIGGKFVVNPSQIELNSQNVEMEAFVAGPAGKLNMIEMSGSDTQEADALEALKLGMNAVDTLVAFQKKLVAELGQPKADVKLAEPDPALVSAVESYMEGKAYEAVYPHLTPRDGSHPLDKVERERRLASLKAGLTAELESKFEDLNKMTVEHLFETVIDNLVHKNILEKELRPDSRKMDEIRPLDGEVGLFERTHGSGLFVRGNTQALAITTIAPPGQEQVIETMETNGKRRFMLHYNFPPYSVGETGRLGTPGRREIGHGALALKAVLPVLPTADEFPYTIRVVSEILSSNGSSSMATVCATTLSLMDAGVPIKKPVAGIAMGLMSNDKGDYKVLTDLQGPEDHYGDMDFKVAGTKDGINAIQLDVKLEGLTLEMAEKTLAQAKAARLQILDVIKGIIPEPRKEISKYAPKVVRIRISKEKIGALIGPGGKVINGLIEKYKLAGIDIEEDGAVSVGSSDQASLNAALEEINMITRDIKVGDIVEGNIIKIMEFGAIVDLGGGMDGMIHVSELKDGFVKTVDEVVKLGDFVRAKVIRAEEGRIGLSLKRLNEN